MSMASLTPSKYIQALIAADKLAEVAKIEAWIDTLKLNPDEVPAFIAWWEDNHGESQ